METNKCDINHLDSDALLPPRKRLLAGLKKQSYDVTSPAPSTTFSNYDTHLNYLLRSHFGNPNLSNEEIVEASGRAAVQAAKVAEAARANAEEKAAKAAKAMAAAKTALDLVATLEEKAAKKEKGLKKNKMKKHLPVQALYNKKKGSTNCRRDEEMARNLHRAINSSPRIMKSSPSSDSKNRKLKRVKSNGSDVVEVDMIMVDLNTSKPDSDDDEVRLDNGDIGILSKDKCAESDSCGKKRARIKQKKLPLSICNIRDQTSPKASNQDLFSVETSGNNSLMAVERTSLWKCQAFKAPVCVTQNKLMQS